MHSFAWLLFWCLLALALAQLAWGLRYKSRFLQFPTLASGAWLFYLIPQAYGALKNPDKFPPAVLADHGLELALGMCILCLVFGWWGWVRGMGSNLSVTKYSNPSQRQIASLFLYGFSLCAMGLCAAWLLSRLMGGFVAQFTDGAHYSIEWAGTPVKYSFFIELIYPGLLFCLLAVLQRSSAAKILILSAFSIYPICTVIFLGRRSLAVVLASFLLLSFFFVRRFVIKRWVLLCLLLLGGLVAAMAPAYRSTMAFTGNFKESLRNIDTGSTLGTLLRGEQYAEFDALVVGCAFAQKTKRFDFGTIFYNGLVQTMVPRQFLGDEFKQSLFIDLYARDRQSTATTYAWEIPYGSNPTGILNAFQAFWFLGSLFYFGLAWWLSRVWRRAVAGSTFNQAAYILAVHPALYAIIAGWGVLPGIAVVFTCLLLPCGWILNPEMGLPMYSSPAHLGFQTPQSRRGRLRRKRAREREARRAPRHDKACLMTTHQEISAEQSSGAIRSRQPPYLCGSAEEPTADV